MTAAEFATYMEGLATKHSLIDFSVYGSLAKLQAEWAKVDNGRTCLMIEFPGMRVRDQGGSIDGRYVAGISVISATTNNDYTAEAADISLGFDICVDLLTRMRYDMSQSDYVFYINDVSEIQPVTFYTLENAHGARFEVEFGEWFQRGPNADRWSDLT